MALKLLRYAVILKKPKLQPRLVQPLLYNPVVFNQVLFSDKKKKKEKLEKTKSCRPDECNKKAVDGDEEEIDLHACPKPICCNNMKVLEVDKPSDSDKKSDKGKKDGQEVKADKKIEMDKDADKGKNADKQPKDNKEEKAVQKASSDDQTLSVSEEPEGTELIVCEEEQYEPKVIIIGAGIAGLAAANRLATTGVKNVVILEASNRTGGRIQSTWFGDTVVNLGGSFEPPDGLPETSAENPVLFNAQQLGLVRFRDKIPLAMSMITEFDGTPLPLAASFLALNKMQRILAVADSLKTTSPYNDQGKQDNYIGLRMKQELRAMSDELKIPAVRVMAALTLLYTGNNYISESKGDPVIQIPGCDINVPLGANGVISPMTQNVSIKHNKEVINISWGSLNSLNGERAIVSTNDGCEYLADFIIFTPSLGVLKNRHNTIFCPSLPSAKVQAIENVRFENATKIFFYYKKPIKSWRGDKINWKLTEDDTKGLHGILGGLRRVIEVPRSDKVLSIIIRGNGAKKAETTSRRALVDELTMYIIKKSGDCAPLPDDVLVTKWHTNRHYSGSFVSRGNCELSEPVPFCGSPNPPVIFFAGDSTIDAEVGGVHGAYVSGIREANRILSYIPGDKEDVRATDACLQLQSSLST